MIKYFVRTMEGRPDILPDYFEKIIDTEHKYVKSYIDALYKISEYDAVLVEDDIVLCNNFKEEIEKVIAQYPNEVINFFSNPERYYTTYFSELWNYNQCTYFPKGLAKTLADEMMKYYYPEGDPKKVKQRYGHLLGISLTNLGKRHLMYRPALVQHIDGISTFDGAFFQRNTIYFKDYLDRLGITMDEAYDINNRKALKKLLDADRAVWYKDIDKYNKYV